jgi:uncharacterized protein YlxW (UPF0749 family)
MTKQTKNRVVIFCMVIFWAVMGLVCLTNVRATSQTQTEALSTSGNCMMLALTQEQIRQCQAEQQALQQQLNQCGSDAKCRAAIQAAIDNHNQRCR